MQASVLFSLAVSTDFTPAAGKRGHMCLRCSCKGCHCGRGPGRRRNRIRERQGARPSKKDDEEEWSAVDNFTGAGEDNTGSVFHSKLQIRAPFGSLCCSAKKKKQRSTWARAETRWSYCLHLRPLLRNHGQEREEEEEGGGG